MRRPGTRSQADHPGQGMPAAAHRSYGRPMRTAAPGLHERLKQPSGEMEEYLGTMPEQHSYGVPEGYEYPGLAQINPIACDPAYPDQELQMSYDGSCYSDYATTVYSGSCYEATEPTMYPDLNHTMYDPGPYPKPEQDLAKYPVEPKYIDNRYSMEGGELANNSPTMQYINPKMKPKYEYQMAPVGRIATKNSGNMTPTMQTNVTPRAARSAVPKVKPQRVDMVSPARPKTPLNVSTHDLAVFNSVMDGSALTPMRSASGNMVPAHAVKANATPTYGNEMGYPQYYHYEESPSSSPFLRHQSPPRQSKRPRKHAAMYNYDAEYAKGVDSIVSYPSDQNISTTTASPVQDLYSSAERSVSTYPPSPYSYPGVYGNNMYHAGPQEVEPMPEQYFVPTTVTTNVVTTYTVTNFDPTIPCDDRYDEILKTVLALPCVKETFLSPVNTQVLTSHTILELSRKYDETQRSVIPPETHIVYVRNNSEMNLIMRNENMLVQHTGHSKGEKLKLTKQLMSSKHIATSADLNESITRSRNDEQGLSYLPYVSCNWKGVHETSWWMSDDKGIVRNFKVSFDPMVFGSKTLAFDEATKFAKYVEGVIRPGTLINWYPGFNIPIGTSGRANLRKVLHMDRMKNADLCDPVLEANGLKVAPKSTFGDMIIVELYKAAYVLGLWDVAAYNCLKTCKRRGYSFEWIQDIQSTGKRITLDALKYMRNVKEVIEQDKISRVNMEKKRRRRKMPDKRRRAT